MIANDSDAALRENRWMTRRRSTPPNDLGHRWYLAEWAQHFRKTQADAQRELDWNKATASVLWNNKQRYNQEIVDEVARWLRIEPFELLMPPHRAFALRNIRDSAKLIVAEEDPPPFLAAPIRRTGTEG